MRQHPLRWRPDLQRSPVTSAVTPARYRAQHGHTRVPRSHAPRPGRCSPRTDGRSLPRRGSTPEATRPGAARDPDPALQPADRASLRRLDSSVHRVSSDAYPAQMGASDVSQFLTWLAVDRQVSASTQNQALSALLFLYKHVLAIEITAIPPVVRARTPERLPVVLSREEIGAILKQLTGTPRLIVMVLYGSGGQVGGVSRSSGQGPRFRSAPDHRAAGKGAK